RRAGGLVILGSRWIITASSLRAIVSSSSWSGAGWLPEFASAERPAARQWTSWRALLAWSSARAATPGRALHQHAGARAAREPFDTGSWPGRCSSCVALRLPGAHAHRLVPLSRVRAGGAHRGGSVAGLGPPSRRRPHEARVLRPLPRAMPLAPPQDL